MKKPPEELDDRTESFDFHADHGNASLRDIRRACDKLLSPPQPKPKSKHEKKTHRNVET